jgi:hypothetical protein
MWFKKSPSCPPTAHHTRKFIQTWPGLVVSLHILSEFLAWDQGSNLTFFIRIPAGIEAILGIFYPNPKFWRTGFLGDCRGSSYPVRRHHTHTALCHPSYTPCPCVHSHPPTSYPTETGGPVTSLARLAGYAASCMQDLRRKWTSRLSSHRPGMHCCGPTLTALALAHVMTTKPAPAAACIYVPRILPYRVLAQCHRFTLAKQAYQSSGTQESGRRPACALHSAPASHALRHLPQVIFSAISCVLLPLAHSLPASLCHPSS